MSCELTLDKLMAHVVEDDGHLIWVGHACEGRYPQINIDGKARPVRRVVYEAVHGPLNRGLQVGVACGRDLCVHPDCLLARKKSTAQPRQPLAPDRKARIAMARRRNSRMTMELARAIRVSTEPGPVIEARHGLGKGYASRIRTNRCWVDHASPFAGLMA